ncbi:uncharacterized protein LOC106160050 [Lingula anatina]|uniref:Uncharacterized protein LOC106160050 n=1 Tax=Lingula anatina TaxID=7574 RepID=A0A1S3I177_LINAN|nr:uncharacterized protein LOC106160050 [Lingula anatina]|eukprot:XP_013392017.1 uncharacterized protein LOC106160050 [Lingula anatina]
MASGGFLKQILDDDALNNPKTPQFSSSKPVPRNETHSPILMPKSQELALATPRRGSPNQSYFKLKEKDPTKDQKVEFKNGQLIIYAKSPPPPRAPIPALDIEVPSVFGVPANKRHSIAGKPKQKEGYKPGMQTLKMICYNEKEMEQYDQQKTKRTMPVMLYRDRNRRLLEAEQERLKKKCIHDKRFKLLQLSLVSLNPDDEKPSKFSKVAKKVMVFKHLYSPF